MNKPLKGFIPYSHKNRTEKDTLRTHLAVMEQQNILVTWHDGDITAGDRASQEDILKEVADSDILLYLVSAASLASQNCNKELAEALKENLRIISIILEACDWENHQLSNFEVLPDKGSAINQWEPESDGWNNVVKGVREAVDKMLSQTIPSPRITQEDIDTLAGLALQKGNFVMMLGQMDAAVAAYSRAIELNPNNAAAYNNRGVVYGQKGDFSSAIKDFDTAIRLNPNFAAAYYNRGGAYDNKSKHDLAIVDFTKAIKLKPDNASAYSNRGASYQEKVEFDRAIADYTKAIELNPKYVEGYSNRGFAYSEKGDLDRAIVDCAKAIELNPNLAEIYYNRGEAWLHLGEWESAKSDLTIADDMGVDIIASFHNTHENVKAYERANRVKLPEDIAAMLTQRRRSRFPKTEKFLSSDGTRIQSSDVSSLLAKLSNAGTPLSQYVQTRPTFGIKTSSSNAFVVDSATRDRLIAEHPASEEILKPFLHRRDIRRWQVEIPDSWLIFSCRGIEINRFPAIQKHLEKYRASLSKMAGKHEWYELPAGKLDAEFFTQTKLICPNTYDHQTFAVDTDGFYCGDTCYLIPTEETWLCGLLNSRVVEWFYSQVSNQLTGDYLRARSGYMQKIPIPDLMSTQKLLIGKIVDYLIYLQGQPTTNGVDLAHARDAVMLKYFERIIDGLVYESYLNEDLHHGGKHFFKPLVDERLPQIEEIRGDKMSALREIFESLYEKKHPVRCNLFFLDSVNPIRIIEGKA